MDTGTIATIMVFMIPIIAMLVGGFMKWLEFKAKQDQLGSSTQDLEAAVELLQADRAALRRRIETLEAIVTDESWDTPEVSRCPSATPPPPGSLT